MPNAITLNVVVSELPSPRGRRMARALHRMARALDEMQALSADKLTLLAAGRYERATDDYQAALLAEYDAWVAVLLKKIGDETDAERVRQVIIEAMPDLRAALQAVAQESLPDAVNALSAAYVPSADAYRLIADAITENNADIETRLIPAVEEKLLRAVADGTPLEQAAQAMVSRVSGYAGAFWVLLQRLIGDFIGQKQTADDEIYPVRWVRVDDEHSCDSCIAFEGEYPSYNAMLEATNQCVPGYFFNSPYQSACWGFCRCHLEAFIKGKWIRL